MLVRGVAVDYASAPNRQIVRDFVTVGPVGRQGAVGDFNNVVETVIYVNVADGGSSGRRRRLVTNDRSKQERYRENDEKALHGVVPFLIERFSKIALGIP
jgi:hypothetical protein